MTALAVVAIILGGCAAANNATSSQAADQAEQPYKTAYGISSDGPTTDLYSELFGPRRRDDQTVPPTTATQPVQPAPTVAATQPVQPVAAPASSTRPATATASTRQAKPAMASTRQAQPAPAPVEVAQQAAPPQPPAEPDVPAAYGITANGPTTDLFTELFGPRRRDGQ
jgi:outer membrane biosynthesis protein TonB